MRGPLLETVSQLALCPNCTFDEEAFLWGFKRDWQKGKFEYVTDPRDLKLLEDKFMALLVEYGIDKAEEIMKNEWEGRTLGNPKSTLPLDTNALLSFPVLQRKSPTTKLLSRMRRLRSTRHKRRSVSQRR